MSLGRQALRLRQLLAGCQAAPLGSTAGLQACSEPLPAALRILASSQVCRSQQLSLPSFTRAMASLQAQQQPSLSFAAQASIALQGAQQGRSWTAVHASLLRALAMKTAGSKAAASTTKAAAKPKSSKPADAAKEAAAAKIKKSAGKGPKSPYAEFSRSPTAYNLFVKENFAAARVSTGGKTTEAMKLLSQQYKQLTDEQKEKYVAEAQKLKENTAEERSKIKEEIKKKQAISPFIHFVKAQRLKVKEENPHVNPRDLVKLLGEQWRSMTAEAKAPYLELTKQERLSKGLPAEPKYKKQTQ